MHFKTNIRISETSQELNVKYQTYLYMYDFTICISNWYYKLEHSTF